MMDKLRTKLTHIVGSLLGYDNPKEYGDDVEPIVKVLVDLFDRYKEAEIVEARIKARSKLLHKLIRTYSLIATPIKDSPMELTDEAKYYNKFVKDLQKFVDIELAKHESLKPPTGEK